MTVKIEDLKVGDMVFLGENEYNLNEIADGRSINPFEPGSTAVVVNIDDNPDNPYPVELAVVNGEEEGRLYTLDEIAEVIR